MTEPFPTEDFFQAFGTSNWQKLESFFHPKLRFRALVPGPEGGGELRTTLDAAGAIRYLRAWFGEADHFEVIKSEAYPIATRLHLSYCLRIHDTDGWWTIEQRMYCDVKDSLIEGLDLLCSGFMLDEQGLS